MKDRDQNQKTSHLTAAYARMLQFAKDALAVTKRDVLPAAENAVQVAKEKLIALGEISLEEAEKVEEYLLRDLQDAAHYISRNKRDFSAWLSMDMKLIEAQLSEQFALLTNHTKAELDHLAQVAARYGEWHTGEITGLGALECKQCQQQMHFDKVSHIPPCPKCHHTKFKRASRS